MKKLKFNEKSKGAVFYILYMILCVIPMLRLGICCGDDLYWQSCTRDGIDTLAKCLWREVCYQGRPLGIMQLPSLILSFFDNMLFFKMSKVFFVMLNTILVAKIIKRFFNDSATKVFVVLFPISISIAFQNSPPECYTIFILLPLAYFLISCILFDYYLKKRKMWYNIVSLILLFLSLACYEIFILYIPLLFFISYASCVEDNKIKCVFNAIKKMRFHIFVTFFYLLCYFSLRFIFPANYNGVKLQIDSISSVFKILKMLIISGVPGMYMYDAEVKHLLTISKERYINTYETFFYNIDLRVIILLIMLCYLIFKIYRKSKKESFNRYFFFLFYFVLVPPILNAVSASWQVFAQYEGRIIGSTVSYLITIAVVCIISVFISSVLFKKWQCLVMGMCLICVWCANIQVNNDLLSHLQKQCYNRIENAEEIICNSIVDEYNIDDIYAPKLFQPVLMIGIRDDYWDSYTKYNNLSIDISESYDKQNWFLNCNEKGNIYWFSNIQVVENDTKVSANNVIIMSRQNLDGTFALFKTVDESEQVIEVQLAAPRSSDGFYVYAYNFDYNINLEQIYFLQY